MNTLRVFSIACLFITLSSSFYSQCAIEVSVNVTHESAVGANDGQGAASQMGAVGSNYYIHYDINGNSVSLNNTASGLAPGDYYVVAIDSGVSNCTDTAYYTINPGSGGTPCNLAANITGSDETAAGANDGTAQVTVTGNTGSVTYSWSNGETTDNISGLTPDTYVVTVTESPTCEATASIVINPYSGGGACLLQVDINATDETAAGANDGTAEAVVTGNAGSVTYEWSNGETVQTISGLSPATYSVTVTETATCIAINTVTIQPFSGPGCSLDVVVSASGETAAGANDGTATATVIGNQGPYSVIWSSGDTTESLSGLSPGAYSITVTDTAGCTAIGSASVLAFDTSGGGGGLNCLLFIVGAIGTDELTPAGGDGQAVASVPPIFPGPVTYEWSNGETSQINAFLDAGTYTVTATDQSTGCVDSATVIIEPYGGNQTSDSCDFEISISTTNVSDSGAADGSAQVTVDPPGSYSYSWNTGVSGPAIFGLQEASYSVTVTDDQAGCSLEDLAFVGGPGDTNTVGLNLIEVSKNDITIYPNPVSDILHVEFKETVNAPFMVYDLKGQLLYTSRDKFFKKGSVHQLDLSYLSKGTYFLSIHLDNAQVITKSFLVLRLY